MMRRLWVTLIFVFVLVFPVAAQDVTESMICEQVTAEGTRRIIPRFDLYVTQLEILDYDTRESITTMAIPDGINRRTNKFPPFWSPNCRYVGFQFMEHFAIWDVEASSPVYQLPGQLRRYETVTWHLQGHFLLIPMTDENYVWQAASNSVITLEQPDGVRKSPPRLNHEITWDDARGVVLAYFITPANYYQLSDEEYEIYSTVFAFSTASGGVAARYSMQGGRTWIHYKLSPDGSRIAVFTEALGFHKWSPRPVRLIIYNRDNGSSEIINVEGFVGVSGDQVAFSADNRYIAVGNAVLRVWDLSQLAADVTDRVPTYRHEAGNPFIVAVRFIDSDTIETTDGWFISRQWNRETGAEIIPST